MNERESIAEIITDMRKRATVASRQDGDAMVHHSAIGDMLTDFANRIEATYEREIAAMRLRSITRPHGQQPVIAELQRRLRVAERKSEVSNE